jgi:TonB family protein
MSCRLTLVVFAIALLCGTERGVAAQVTLSDEFKTLVTYAPRPEYPYEARVKHLTGRRTVLLNVDSRTGHVTSARMLETTGHRILDDAAVDAFRQWRFKPGTVDKIKAPITFSLQRVSTGGLGGKALALYAARPSYPAEARSKHWTGTGIVLVEVDRNTGQVTSARMLQSTGHQILDEAALNAFRQWRFRPGTASKIRIPINFTMAGVAYPWPYATHINP